MLLPILFAVCLFIRMTGNPIAWTHMWNVDRSTSSRASSGSHGFKTIRSPRNDHGLCRQMRLRSSSVARRNTRVFCSMVLVWVLVGIPHAFDRVDLIALLFRGLSHKTLAMRG
ncbi:hypothetical protein Salat_0938100 [Sesamum alatum]|uniref:Secreted protein n=1 Tax=Sesamum alatum TaxID=300844 RepID=A0AAE1YK01_9LAMI|nr:hypothetical protein Salat_0938100 [Sesamum alatum]